VTGALTKTQGRIAVLIAAAPVTLIKLYLAATTGGSNDVRNFQKFANGVRQFGPIKLYGEKMALAQYNHPPLIGWMLAGMNWLDDHGLSFPFLIRLPATLADVVTALLVYELVRAQRPRQAVLAGVTAAVSPILIVISGYHGNTDPVFVMFAMLSFWLLVTSRSSLLAGACFGLALSIKIVPIVVAPLLLFLAFRAGWRRGAGFLAGGGVVFAVLWLPVVLLRWSEFSANVLGYSGYGEGGRWGLVAFANGLGLPKGVESALIGPGRFVVLLIAAGLPLLIAWRRPRLATLAFGLCFTLMLLLSTATATQYLAWAAAPSLLVSVWPAVAYNLAGGVLVVDAYSDWADAPPWRWDNAFSHPFDRQETIVAGVVWFVLAAVVVAGIRTVLRTGPEETATERALPISAPVG
jgi:4-amino-4-deoxy-L-arabinose transferase-like glycosyltransferase